MPIFVSRFSGTRIAGANLQGVRARENEGTNRLRTASERPAENIRQDEGDRQGRVVPARERENLLVRNQLGDLLQARLQERGNTRSGEARNNGQMALERANDGGERLRGSAAEGSGTVQTEVQRRVPPGVGSVRSRADRDIERPGRLGQEPANPAAAQALDRFAQLRAVARGGSAADGGAGRQTRADFPEVPAPQAPPLNREIDARIRLLASRNGARGTGAPDAEEISRANTTPEIRENLQDNTREVGRGLVRDAGRQTRENTQQTVRAAAQAGGARREGEVRSTTAETRELRTVERRLERELVQTQREIRNLENQNSRLQGSTNRSTAATAAAIGTRVDLLVD